MRDRDGKHDLLRHISLFAGLDRSELEKLSETTTELDLPAGSVLAREGKPGHDAFVVLDGTVDISIGGRVVGSAGPNEIVGEMALLLHEPRQATLTAATPVSLLVIEPGRFEALLEDVPAIARHLVKVLARRLRDADQRWAR